MYRIIGADQREYGPVSQEQLRDWVREGRANARTLVRYGDGPWQPLSSFPEFHSDFAAARPPGYDAPATYGMPLAPQTNGMAVAGLVLSCVGLLCCCGTPLFSTLGLILSAIGYSQINNNPGRWTGRNLAIAGMILAAVGFVIFVTAYLTGQFTAVVERGRGGRW